jgi:hypothetical protein
MQRRPFRPLWPRRRFSLAPRKPVNNKGSHPAGGMKFDALQVRARIFQRQRRLGRPGGFRPAVFPQWRWSLKLQKKSAPLWPSAARDDTISRKSCPTSEGHLIAQAFAVSPTGRANRVQAIWATLHGLNCRPGRGSGRGDRTRLGRPDCQFQVHSEGLRQ